LQIVKNINIKGFKFIGTFSGVEKMRKTMLTVVFLFILLALPSVLAVDTLNFEIREYITLTFNASKYAYSLGDSMVLPVNVSKINGEIIVSNYANRTVMTDINFGVNRSGGLNWTNIPSGVLVKTLGNGIYLVHINELQNGSSVTLEYYTKKNLPKPPLNITVEYFENGTLAGPSPIYQTRILTNTTTDLDIRINFTNIGISNVTELYINQSNAIEPIITWQHTYWYNSSERSSQNRTNFPYNILHWCNSDNPLSVSPPGNNISCNFYVRTQVNIDPDTQTPILVDWQNMTIGFKTLNVSSNISLNNVLVKGVKSHVYVEKKRGDFENFSGDLAFKSNVSTADPGVMINVTSMTIWISGSHNPNNVSLDPKDNTTPLVKTYPINISKLKPRQWVNSTNKTGTGTPIITPDRWKVTPWSENRTYNRGVVPIYWGRANYTLSDAVFRNFRKNRSSYHFDSNYTIYEKIYLLRGYLVRVRKVVKSLSNNLWNINITVSNIGNQYTPTLYVYDLIPQNFTVQVSKIRVFPYDALNESIQHPLNYTGNQSISGTMYDGVSYWWKLNPIPNGGNVNITYNATGTGTYYTRDLFVVGIDPVTGYGQVAITPTIDMVQGAVSSAVHEALFMLMTVLFVVAAVVKRVLLI